MDTKQPGGHGDTWPMHDGHYVIPMCRICGRPPHEPCEPFVGPIPPKRRKDEPGE